MTRRLTLLTTLTSIALALTACGAPLSSGTSGTGHATVQLTDAPATDASSLIVNFGRIDLVPADGTNTGIRRVTTDGGTVDVLTLRNGGLTALGGIDLPAGTYHQLRLVVEDANIAFNAGADVFPVTVPSGAQSGIKINVDPPLVVRDGETSTVTIDFDAARGVIETPPGSQNYLFKPTAIRATTISGVLTGYVEDDTGTPVEGATVDVSEAGGAPVTSTVTEADGSFAIITLPEGSYDLSVSATGFQTLDQNGLTVTAGVTTDLGTLTLTPVAP